MKLRNKKTGEVWDVWSFYDGRQTINLKYSNNDVVATFECNSLSELNEEWEDYTPTEPLIKDEKVRKAVRAWAEANDIGDGITYLGDGEFRSYLNTTIDFAILVDEHRFDLLKKSEDYAVTELCGEEEE